MLNIRCDGFWKRLLSVLTLLIVATGSCGDRAGAESASTPLLAGSPVAYIAGLDELPLMRPLIENMKERVVFETPAGRIVEAYASGPARASEVMTFYKTTLPQLGWRRSSTSTDMKMSYEREGERLTIDFPEGRSVGGNGATLKVRFTVRPLEVSGGSSKNTP